MSGPFLRRTRASGYTLMELMMVLALLSVMLAFAIPPVSRMRARAALRNARAMVTRALVEARMSAARFQRVTVLTLDGSTGVMRAAVDTASSGSNADSLVVGRFDLVRDLGVTLQSDRAALCFDGTGVGTVAPACPLAGATIVLQRAQFVDTLLVNGAGRVWR